MIKEVIGKEKMQQQNFPENICIRNKEITDLKTIAEKFNKFFTESGPNLVMLNVIKTCFGSLYKPLLNVFNQSLESRIFADKLKVPKVTLLFKKESDSELENYQPISVIPCFSKVLEKIMYNRLYKHLKEKYILYKKQFGFQQKHTSEHAILQLIDQVNKINLF